MNPVLTPDARALAREAFVAHHWHAGAQLQALPADASARRYFRLLAAAFPGEADVQYEAIEVVVYRLRRRLSGSGVTVMTLRGLGYLLRLQP